MQITLTADIEAFLRQKLSDGLAQCTEKQRAFFYKLHPNVVSAEKLQTALGLVENTVRKNRARSGVETAAGK